MTIDIDTAKKILSGVDKIDSFKLKHGRELFSLEDLYNALSNMSEEEFKHHVNNEKNDFSVWIENCIKDKHLADSLKDTTTKEKIEEKIKSRLFILKLMTVLKGDFIDNSIKENDEKKAEAIIEKELEKIEKENDEKIESIEKKMEKKIESLKAENNSHLPRHDLSNLKSEKQSLLEIKNYINEMEKNEEHIVQELHSLELENKGLQKLFNKNFLHGFLLGLIIGFTFMIVGLKIVLMING